MAEEREVNAAVMGVGRGFVAVLELDETTTAEDRRWLALTALQGIVSTYEPAEAARLLVEAAVEVAQYEALDVEAHVRLLAASLVEAALGQTSYAARVAAMAAKTEWVEPSEDEE